MDTQYVGQGVGGGTPIVMHGVTVGHVRTISSLRGGGVRLNVDLQKAPVSGLTDAMDIDFRPINYFGVTGINLVAGSGGRPLHDGVHLSTVSTGNFTLQALLSRLGQVSTGVLTPELVQVIDRAARYTDALNPLIETAFIATNAVAQVQTLSTMRLLTNTAGLSAVFPSTVNALVGTGENFLHSDEDFRHHGTADASPDDWQHKYIATLQVASEGVFNAVGTLESKHVGDLLQFVDTVKDITDVVPPLIRPEGFAQELAEMRSRFEKMYAGPPGQRALQVRIVLDSLPGVAAPINAIGGP
ncbi:MAG: Mammalian cell entry related domain protein [Mycobacterium sp.]